MRWTGTTSIRHRSYKIARRSYWEQNEKKKHSWETRWSSQVKFPSESLLTVLLYFRIGIVCKFTDHKHLWHSACPQYVQWSMGITVTGSCTTAHRLNRPSPARLGETSPAEEQKGESPPRHSSTVQSDRVAVWALEGHKKARSRGSLLTSKRLVCVSTLQKVHLSSVQAAQPSLSRKFNVFFCSPPNPIQYICIQGTMNFH